MTLGAPELLAPPSRPHKLAQRLAPEVIEQIIVDYLAGSSTRKLGLKYGLHKNSILGLLKRNDVSKPRTKITDEQVDQALKLFRDGHSLVKAAQQLGLASTTMVRAFQRRGLPTRHG